MASPHKIQALFDFLSEGGGGGGLGGRRRRRRFCFERRVRI